MSTAALIRDLRAMSASKPTSSSPSAEPSEPTPQKTQPPKGADAGDPEMDTEGLLVMEASFGKGAAPRKILTTKGVSLTRLIALSK